MSGDGTALGPGSFRVNPPTEYANTPAVVYDADHAVFMVVWQDNRVNSQIPVLYGRALSYQQSGAPAFRATDFRISELVQSHVAAGAGLLHRQRRVPGVVPGRVQ